MKKISLIAIVFSLTITSCRFLEITPEAEQKYLDLNEYFKEESKRLNAEDKSLKKTVIKDNLKEEKIIEDPEWEKELAAFLEVDINKPAFIDAYTTDTIVISENSYKIIYQAIEETTIIPIISLLFENNSCIFVTIKKNNSNKLFSSIQELQYDKKKGYSINGELVIRFIYDTQYTIKSKFINYEQDE